MGARARRQLPIDEVIRLTAPRFSERLPACNDLRQKNYTCAIDFRDYTNRHSSPCFPLRRGHRFERDWAREEGARSALHRACYSHWPPRAEKLFAGGKSWGVSRPARPEYTLRVPAVSAASVRARWPSRESKNYIVVAGGSWRAKCWPARNATLFFVASCEAARLARVVIHGPVKSCLRKRFAAPGASPQRR